MPKYQFRLETLKKLREARRDERRTALAEAYHAEQVLANNRRAIADEQNQLRDLQRAAAADHHPDINRMLEASRYDMVLRSNQQQLSQQEKLLAVETERRRLALVEADREVRTLEMLDDRHRREHDQRRRRQESRLLDEVASVQHVRRQ